MIYHHFIAYVQTCVDVDIYVHRLALCESRMQDGGVYDFDDSSYHAVSTIMAYIFLVEILLRTPEHQRPMY